MPEGADAITRDTPPDRTAAQVAGRSRWRAALSRHRGAAVSLALTLVVVSAGAATLALPAVRHRLGTLANSLRQGAALAPEDGSPAPSVSASRRPTPRPSVSHHRSTAQASPTGPVRVNIDGVYSWALLDRRTATIRGSSNDTETISTTESMVKTWIAGDFLRQLGDKQPGQDRLDELSTMIRDSDDDAAEDIYEIDGSDEVIHRMIETCGLTNTWVSEGYWWATEISARDAVRLGICVADGRAAGPRWTSWLLGEMRLVRGEGRFGIIEALPADVAATTSIKNGWTYWDLDDEWHVACLAIRVEWVLSVIVRYPGAYGLDYGAQICKSVAQQVLYPGSLSPS